MVGRHAHTHLVPHSKLVSRYVRDKCTEPAGQPAGRPACLANRKRRLGLNRKQNLTQNRSTQQKSNINNLKQVSTWSFFCRCLLWPTEAASFLCRGFFSGKSPAFTHLFVRLFLEHSLPWSQGKKFPLPTHKLRDIKLKVAQTTVRFIKVFLLFS